MKKTAVDHPDIARARKLANLLDSAFTIPIIRKKIGLDPLLGLLPVGGDVVALVLASYILLVAYRLQLPTSVLVRMLANLLLDFSVGSVPVVGDIFDAFWKSNRRNLEILEKAYAQYGGREALVMPDGVIDVEAEVAASRPKGRLKSSAL